MPTVEYQLEPPPSPSNADGRKVVLPMLLGLSLIPLLVINLDPSAPIGQGLGAASPMAQQARRVRDLTLPIAQLADGRNVELHFDRAPQLPPAADNIADALYYGLNYTMYPARAYIGDGRRIVNGGAQLTRADQVPTDARLRELGVVAVVRFPLDAQGLHRPTAIPVR